MDEAGRRRNMMICCSEFFFFAQVELELSQSTESRDSSERGLEVRRTIAAILGKLSRPTTMVENAVVGGLRIGGPTGKACRKNKVWRRRRRRRRRRREAWWTVDEVGGGGGGSEGRSSFEIVFGEGARISRHTPTTTTSTTHHNLLAWLWRCWG